MENKERRQGFPIQGIVVSVSIGSALALVGCCLLLLCLSISVSTGLVPARSMRNLCMILVAVCSLIGGRFAVRKGFGAPALMGPLTGVMICVLILIVSFLCFPATEFQASQLWIPFAAMAGASISGFSAPKKKKKQARRKK